MTYRGIIFPYQISIYQCSSCLSLQYSWSPNVPLKDDVFSITLNTSICAAPPPQKKKKKNAPHAFLKNSAHTDIPCGLRFSLASTLCFWMMRFCRLRVFILKNHQLACVTNLACQQACIIYHIIYHIISFHIIYYIIYHVSYHIVSYIWYDTLLYGIISYHIISRYDSSHKRPVTSKIFPFHDVIMVSRQNINWPFMFSTVLCLMVWPNPYLIRFSSEMEVSYVRDTLCLSHPEMPIAIARTKCNNDICSTSICSTLFWIHYVLELWLCKAVVLWGPEKAPNQNDYQL